MALTPAEEAQTRDLIAQQAALLSLAGVEPTILSKLGASKVTLSDLPTASAINDADLLLLRQGVTDKSVTGLTFKGLIPTVADASETVKGVVELATSTEVIAGTDTVRAVTPAGLQSKVASATASGIVELATNAEVQTGTDTVRAVTPAGFNAASLGHGQTWQNVLPSRAVSTIYTNTTGRPIMVNIHGGDGTARAVQVSIDAVTWIDVGQTGQTSDGELCSFVVPSGYSYRVNGSVPTLNAWSELR